MAVRTTNPSSCSSSSSRGFDPQRALADAMRGGMSSTAVGQTHSVLGELKGIFLTRDAKTTLVPQLDRAIEKTKAASTDAALTPEGLASVYDVSSESMRRTKSFYLRADEIGATLGNNRTVEEITSRVNQLSENVNEFAGSEGFDAALERVPEDDETLATTVETSMDKYERRAEKALGVANLPKALETFQEVERVLATDEVSQEEIEAIFERAVKASSVITGAIKATGKTLLDDSKQTSTSFKSRLKARALQAREKLQAATLRVTKDSRGKLRTTLEGSAVIQGSIAHIEAQEEEVKKVEAKRKTTFDRVVDTDDKKAFIAAAQKAYDNSDISEEVKAHMQQTVMRALKLFTKVIDIKDRSDVKEAHPVEITAQMKPVLAQFILDVYSFYQHAASQTYDIYERANTDLERAKNDNERREIIALAVETQKTHCSDLNNIYRRCLGIFNCYVTLLEDTLKSTGGNELYSRYQKANQEAQQRDKTGRALFAEFNRKAQSLTRSESLSSSSSSSSATRGGMRRYRGSHAPRYHTSSAIPTQRAIEEKK